MNYNNIDFSIPKNIELYVLANRYLYYVLATPILPDSVYDMYEIKAREICPPESDVHKIGSSLPSSYSDEVKSYAQILYSGK